MKYMIKLSLDRDEFVTAYYILGACALNDDFLKCSS
jgi:hypothetical protein